MKPVNAFYKATCFFIALVGIAAATMTFWPTPVAHAATIIVDTVDDEVNNDGDCSLREAVRAANLDQAIDNCLAGSAADTIILSAGDYMLTINGSNEDNALTGDLDITEDLTITGAGRANTSIDANGLDRVFHILSGDVQISGVTITNGDSGANTGGGILMGGDVLILTNSRVTNNTGSSGIYILSSTLRMLNSTIDNNDNKGIVVNIASEVTIVNSTIRHNTTLFEGAGITNAGVLTMTNSTVTNNSTVNSGGGIWNNGGTISLYNVTVTKNTADSDGNNSGDGGGIYNTDGILAAQNTIIGGNTDASGSSSEPDCSGILTSGGYNLVQDTSGCTITGNTTGNLLNVNPQLGPLQDNGGPTLTHALQADSPAIDAGNSAGCTDSEGQELTEDQRNYVRPIDGDGDGEIDCDMGAFERLSPGIPTETPTAPVPTATSSPTSAATATTTPTASATPGASPTPTAVSTTSATHTPTPPVSPTTFPTATIATSATPGSSPTPACTPHPDFPPCTPTPPPVLPYAIYLPLVR